VEEQSCKLLLRRKLKVDRKKIESPSVEIREVKLYKRSKRVFVGGTTMSLSIETADWIHAGAARKGRPEVAK
jgi:hypothetical protein